MSTIFFDLSPSRPYVSFLYTGLASLLVQFVLNVSSMSGACVYVLALEESCVYWMSQAFLLEQNCYLNARLNIFPDTHLLAYTGNAEDSGDPEDLVLQENFSDDENDKEREGEGEGGSSSSQPQPNVLDFSALLSAHNS